MLPVDRLGFTKVLQFSQGEKSTTRQVSTILSGTLFYKEISGQDVKLRENEEIRMSGLKGVIRSGHLKPEALTLRYDGQIREMRRGFDVHGRNLMPNWLEFFKAQKPVELLWATALYLFGMVMAGLKWLKVKV
jgi:hypothetical protein